MGWLTTREAPGHVKRPAAFLAARLADAAKVATTAEQRERLAEAWRDDQRAAADRHVEWQGGWAAPVAQQVSALVAEAFAAPAPEAGAVPGAHLHRADTALQLEDLPEHELYAVRAMADQRPELVLMAIDVMGEAYARRLYTAAAVDRALRRVPRQRADNTTISTGSTR